MQFYAIRRLSAPGRPAALWSRKRRRWLPEAVHPAGRLKAECEYPTHAGMNRVAHKHLREGSFGLEWGILHVTGWEG